MGQYVSGLILVLKEYNFVGDCVLTEYVPVISLSHCTVINEGIISLVSLKARLC
jgi:hypothetical protein